MAWAMVAVTAVGAVAKGIGASKNRKAAEKAAEEAEAAQAIEQGKLDKQIEEYKSTEFKNPYENIQTEYENTYEDLTVNQQQAQFQAQQGAQQRSNIMQGMKGAAGGSGIAGLAQAMANQGQLATQQTSASIGQQETANQKLAAQGASTVQTQEAGAELQIAEGEKMAQDFEHNKQATLLGMQQGTTAGASASAQNADMAQQQARAAQTSAIYGGIGDVAGAAASGIYARQSAPGTNTATNTATGTGGANMRMAVPGGVGASGAPLTVPVMTPTGAEFDIPGAGDYSGGFGGGGIPTSPYQKKKKNKYKTK